LLRIRGVTVHDIHVRLRPGKDDDIARWYKGLEHKSATVREALRGYVAQGEESARRAGETEAGRVRRVVNGDKGELLAAIDRVVKEAVVEAISRELDQLTSRITAVVREALGQGEGEARGRGSEDPELAARLDEQLDSFFDWRSR
jgi:hypothetical protein